MNLVNTKMVSQKQIADELNVHVTLVSKVLNGRMGTSGVSEVTAQRIRETALEMGYRKNANAAALRSGRQQVIAAFIDRRIGAAGSGLIEGLIAGVCAGTRQLHQRQLINFYNDLDEFKDLASDLHAGAVDGLLVSCARPDGLAVELRRLQASGIPVVTVFNGGVDPEILNINVDNAEVIKVATRHLIERGRRRILHLSCSRSHEAGYFEALKEAGLPVDPALVRYSHQEGGVNFTRDQGEAGIRRALEVGLDFDAVCAQSDTQAVGAMYVLIRNGWRIPEDVMITGVDDSPHAQQAFVPLSSVNQQFEQRGIEAVKALSQMTGKSSARQIRLVPELVARASTEAGSPARA